MYLFIVFIILKMFLYIFFNYLYNRRILATCISISIRCRYWMIRVKGKREPEWENKSVQDANHLHINVCWEYKDTYVKPENKPYKRAPLRECRWKRKAKVAVMGIDVRHRRENSNSNSNRLCARKPENLPLKLRYLKA